MPRRWLLLIYTVPTTPSSTRAYVWREIRRQGALLLRDGVAALLDTDAGRHWAAGVARRLGDGGGTAITAAAKFSPGDERRLVDAFRTERAREYAEIVSACVGLDEHIARERDHAEFTFAELEELEADLGKIRRWFAEVRARDRFGAASARSTERSIEASARRLTRFAERASGAELAGRAAGPLAAPRRPASRRSR